ncbi:MAG: undecaprenyl-phosphate glucose phosphotransferase [Syntrophobacterales bacterium]|nr:undecaprenyl-phosphate glucose phosphotransferase [Syntrophobacterales bacterium]
MINRRQGIFDEYRWLISRMQWLLDGIVVVLVLFLICLIYEETFRFRFQILGLFTFLLTIMIFRAAELYQPWRGADLARMVRKVFLAWLVIVAILMAAGYITKTSVHFSRKVLLTWMMLTPVALVVLRLQVYWGLRWMRQQGRNTRTVVIAGAGDLGRRLAKNVVDTPWLGMTLVGFFDDRVTGEVHLPPDHQVYPVLGTLDDMNEYVQANQVRMVYLALPLRAETRLREVVESLQDTTTSVYYVPDIFTFSLLSSSLTDLRGIPLIALWETPFFGVNGWLKRVEDLVLASLILILVSPLLVLIALGVKLSSPGPIIFKQRRYGLDGHDIMVYKFRTMRVCEDGPAICQATKDDDRVTPLGRWLRRTSLDELPQFFNVLTGAMSIVGPRPHAVAHNEYYRRLIPGYMLRHKVRPGLTGWAQINGWRGETETLEKMEKRVEFDLDYLRNWSLWFDLKIIFLTIFRGFIDRHAY